MAEVRVVIVYDDNELKSIEVNDEELDIEAIREVPIKNWFQALNDRSGWEGLHDEIIKIIDDENDEDEELEYIFAFEGAYDKKQEFTECMVKYGFSASCIMDDQAIIQQKLKEAWVAEKLGNYKEAFECFKEAADYGYVAEAQCKTAHYYYGVYKGTYDFEIQTEEALQNAVDYYKKAAEQGYTEAQYWLGRCYSLGEGIEQDYKKAVEWYEKAANQEHAGAQCQLGICYYCGDGVEKNYEEAVQWYRKATEKGESPAQYCLGICYYYGTGVEKDFGKAVEWYKKAAEQEHVESQYQLGGCYYDGTGVEKDFGKAVEWYKKAAEQEHAGAQCQLGNCYILGNGVEKDFGKAVEWYKKATEKGESHAQYCLGICYYYGDGVEKNYEEAVKWYRKAAEQEHARAQYKLGNCYQYGFGVEKNVQEAIIWYLKAAYQGDTDAMNMLGQCYELGIGRTADSENALNWYKKAAEKNSAKGQYNTGRKYYIDKYYTNAISWFLKSADQNNADAQYILGQCYENGFGVNQNMEIARTWYKKAADNETPSPYACYKIAEEFYKQIDPNSIVRTGAIMAVSVLVPVTNIVTAPVGVLGAAKTRSLKYKKFLETDDGKDMLKYYRKAAGLGHEDAQKKLKKLEGYL